MMIYDDSASQFMDDDDLFKHIVNQRTFVCLVCVSTCSTSFFTP